MYLRIGWLLVGVSLFTLSGCTAKEKANEIQKAEIAATDQQYESLGLARDEVAIWEDGTHTEGAEDTYEWWYVDVALEDGSSAVVIFYTRSPQNTETKLKPFATFEWTKADGTVISDRVEIEGKDWVASTETCDVKIGDCTIKGDLEEYEVVFKTDQVEAIFTLNSTLPSWRPETGYRLYGNQGENYAAWLCAVPDATVKAEITTKDETINLTGSGYHDHNWGNQPIWRMQNNWYWGRAKTESYVMIAFNVVAAKEYGNREFPGFLLAKDGKIIADDLNAITFQVENEFIDEQTGIPVAKKLIYDYDDGEQKYQIAFEMKNIILSRSMLPALSEKQKEEVTSLDYQMHYYRFIGSATVTEYEGEKIITSETTQDAIWELMFPGEVKQESSYEKEYRFRK